MNPVEIEEVEIDLLLEALRRVYGYDFKHYARASLKRRIKGFLKKTEISNYSILQEKIIRNKSVFNDFLLEMSITVTEMFRDPSFYIEFREKVIPNLKTYPYIKIWHAGCATGEEVYSMAIMLHEAGYLDKATIYATDFNSNALKIAKEGIFPVNRVQQYTKNYIATGGQSSFADYYRADNNSVKMRDFLKQRITFANHNLVTDKVFGEMNLILCRNVLIYFDKDLQNKVYNLFEDSLCHRGYLCLGNKESLSFSSIENKFDGIDENEKIYRKQ
jgi:chemotaxis protein methyltransferase CheR